MTRARLVTPLRSQTMVMRPVKIKTRLLTTSTAIRLMSKTKMATMVKTLTNKRWRSVDRGPER